VHTETTNKPFWFLDQNIEGPPIACGLHRMRRCWIRTGHHEPVIFRMIRQRLANSSNGLYSYHAFQVKTELFTLAYIDRSALLQRFRFTVTVWHCVHC